MLRSAACSAVVVLFAATSAASQQATPRPRTSVVGVVFDSLVSNAPLSGAEVTIDGTERSALTDSRGRFRIDGVAKGQAVVRFYHSLLDSLGFGTPPSAVTVPDSGTVTVHLATPSARRLLASVCLGKLPPSTGAVIGRVRNVDNRSPLPNAATNANWSEWSLGKGGLVRGEGRATATTNTNGAFALCGVPTDVPFVVRATAIGHVTGLVEVDLGQKLFAVKDFAVSVSDSGSSIGQLATLDSALARGDSVLPSGASIVGGVVRGSHGRLIEQAQVGVLGFPIAVRTGSEGKFALTRLPAGTQTVDIRAVGFAPQRLTIDVRTGERRTLDVLLDDAKAQELAPVNIVGRGMSLDRTGFEDRRKAGLGQFITADEIKRRGVFDTQQALWNVLGARVVWSGSGNVVVFTREAPGVSAMRQGSGFDDVAFSKTKPQCGPIYWIDGSYFGSLGEDIDRVIRPYQIRAIEVYVNPGLAPSLYRRPDDECGLVLIWTKPPQPKDLKQGAPGAKH